MRRRPCMPRRIRERGLRHDAGDPPPPVSEWTARGEASSGAGPLIRLRDDVGAVERDGGRALTVAWWSVAGLTMDELPFVGLPDVVPFALEIVASGAIHDADFEIHYGFVNGGPPRGRCTPQGRVGAGRPQRFSAAGSALFDCRVHRPVRGRGGRRSRRAHAPVGADRGDAAGRGSWMAACAR